MSIKVGIVGAGGMVHYHIPGFLAANADILAICDLNIAAAKRIAEKYGIQNVYCDLAAMLATHPEMEAVSVITPNKFHHTLAIQALQAGKHVFCEKPPALNALEVAAMKDAAEQSGKRLMFNFNNRARPEAYAMMDYIRDGTVGRINSAQARWIRRTGIPGFGGWFTDKSLSGGGPLIDLLHMVDLALYFMDYPEPDYVLGQTFNDFIQDKSFKGPWGIPDNSEGVTNVESAAHGFVRFKTGQVLSLQVSWAEMVKREEVSVTFQGQRAGGMVQRLFERDGLDDTAIDTGELYIQEHSRSVTRHLIRDPDPAMGRIRSAQNFILSLDGKEPPLNNADQALRLMKIIDATYESARTAKPVEVK
jgi:predicted dehydrogenase